MRAPALLVQLAESRPVGWPLVPSVAGVSCRVRHHSRVAYVLRTPRRQRYLLLVRPERGRPLVDGASVELDDAERFRGRRREVRPPLVVVRSAGDVVAWWKRSNEDCGSG